MGCLGKERYISSSSFLVTSWTVNYKPPLLKQSLQKRFCSFFDLTDFSLLRCDGEARSNAKPSVFKVFRYDHWNLGNSQNYSSSLIQLWKVLMLLFNLIGTLQWEALLKLEQVNCFFSFFFFLDISLFCSFSHLSLEVFPMYLSLKLVTTWKPNYKTNLWVTKNLTEKNRKNEMRKKNTVFICWNLFIRGLNEGDRTKMGRKNEINKNFKSHWSIIYNYILFKFNAGLLYAS